MSAWPCFFWLLGLGWSVAGDVEIPTKRFGGPVVINTWPFTDATEAAWQALQNMNSSTPAVDAVVEVLGYAIARSSF